MNTGFNIEKIFLPGLRARYWFLAREFLVQRGSNKSMNVRGQKSRCERLIVLRAFAASREIPFHAKARSREVKTLVYFGLAVLGGALNRRVGYPQHLSGGGYSNIRGMLGFSSVTCGPCPEAHERFKGA